MLKIGRIVVSVATMMASGTVQAGTIFNEDFSRATPAQNLVEVTSDAFQERSSQPCP